MYPTQKMPSTNVFNELRVKITLQRSIPEKIISVCNAVYLRLCIDLMHFTPPLTAEGYDGSHHPRYSEWFYSIRHKLRNIRQTSGELFMCSFSVLSSHGNNRVIKASALIDLPLNIAAKKLNCIR